MLAREWQTRSRAWPWVASAVLAGVLAAGLAVALLGADKTGATAAVKVSALLSFLLFLAAYAGGPLAALFGRRFEALARRGRELGLAFAAALSVHLGLVALTIAWSSHPFEPNGLEIAEMIGAAWIYALAVFSIARLRRLLSPAVWRWMRILGMDYIALIFARNFLSFPLKPLYLPFLLAAVGAIALRIVAIRRRPGAIRSGASGKLRVG